MYVRLAFAVAVNVDPDILVVDEVLAVGDERFQAKCVDRIRRFKEEGRTILLVTHNADQVRALCDRAIVLEGGQHDRRRADAATRCGSSASTCSRTPPSTTQAHLLGTIQIDSVTTPDGSFEIKSGSNLHLEVHVSSQSAYSGNFVLELFTRTGVLVSRSDAQASPVNLVPGRNVIAVDLRQVPLSTGSTTSTSGSSTTTATR